MPFLSVVGRSLRPPPGAGGGGGGGGGDWVAGSFDNGVALPETKLSTGFSSAHATGGLGTTHSVSNSSQLSTALTNSASQDYPVIVITADIDGNWTLPARTGAGYCYIVTEAIYNSTFPKDPGERVAPSDATSMFRLRTTSANTPVFTAATGASYASYYRIVGLEFTSTATQQGALLNFGSRLANSAHFPTHIGVDRCYVYGNIGSLDVRRGIAMHAPNSFVVDCYISSIRDSGATESQALWTCYSPGPMKWVNNYCESAGENIFVGGDATDFTPTDMEIRFNYCFCPDAWEGVYPMKNNFELKIGRRIFIEGNIFENSWVSGQTGPSVVFKNSDDQAGGGGSQYVLEDVVFRNNLCRDYVEPMNILSTQGGGAGGLAPLERLLIRNNAFKSNRTLGRWTITAEDDGSAIDLKIRNNVIECRESASSCYMDGLTAGSKGTGFQFIDNIVPTGGSTGPFHKDGDPGTSSTLSAMFTSPTMTGNAVRGTWTVGVVSGNTASTATTFRNIFTDYANNDFSVATGNWAEGVGGGGADPGVDQTTLADKTQYTESGQRPSEV